MQDLAHLVIAGLATGAIYALVAIGFTLLWQTSQTVNFAQGEFVVVPAFLMLGIMQAGLPFWAAVLLGIGASVLVLGVLFKRRLVDPMLQYGVLPLSIATMVLVLALLLKEAVKDVWGQRRIPFRPWSAPARSGCWA